jgi:hypothetical protein
MGVSRKPLEKPPESSRFAIRTPEARAEANDQERAMGKKQRDYSLGNPIEPDEEYDPVKEGEAEVAAWRKHRERQRMPVKIRGPSKETPSLPSKDTPTMDTQEASGEPDGFGEKHFGMRPLETFFPVLAALDSVKERLRAEFRGRTQAVLAKLKVELPLTEDEQSAHDIITDLVDNESVAKKTIWGLGNGGEFPINIMKFGNVYWIDATEFDPIGYFATLKAARHYAEFNYEPYITEREEATRTKTSKHRGVLVRKDRRVRYLLPPPPPPPGLSVQNQHVTKKKRD